MSRFWFISLLVACSMFMTGSSAAKGVGLDLYDLQVLRQFLWSGDNAPIPLSSSISPPLRELLERVDLALVVLQKDGKSFCRTVRGGASLEESVVLEPGDYETVCEAVEHSCFRLLRHFRLQSHLKQSEYRRKMESFRKQLSLEELTSCQAVEPYVTASLLQMSQEQGSSILDTSEIAFLSGSVKKLHGIEKSKLQMVTKGDLLTGKKQTRKTIRKLIEELAASNSLEDIAEYKTTGSGELVAKIQLDFHQDDGYQVFLPVASIGESPEIRFDGSTLLEKLMSNGSFSMLGSSKLYSLQEAGVSSESDGDS